MRKKYSQAIFSGSVALILFFASFFSSTLLGTARAGTLPTHEVSYSVSNRAMVEVAQDLGLVIGIPVVVASAIRTQKISGNFAGKNSKVFLDKFTKTHKLSWFFDGNRIFLSPEIEIEETILVFPDKNAFEEFNQALEEHHYAGSDVVLEPKEADLRMMVKGHPDYLRRIFHLYRGFIGYERNNIVLPPGTATHTRTNNRNSEGVMIFRLKHSWAGDKTITLGEGKATVIPGVASILNQLLNGVSHSPGDAGADALPAGVSPLLGLGQQRQPPSSPSPVAPARSAGGSGILIMADDRQNAILIRDSVKYYDYYNHLIEDLDRDVPLIEIEAAIIDISKSDIEELGLAWESRSADGAAGFGQFGNTLSGNNRLALNSGTGTLQTAITSNVDGLLASLLFLETEGRGKIVSRPSVLTTDNTEAIINAREQFYIKVEGFQDTSVYPVSVGTVLRVTPHIVSVTGEAHRIKLLVSIQDGTIDATPENSVGALPRVRENAVTTQAIISETESLLIGGHTRTVSERTRRHVPFLGKIPILGLPFSYSKDSTNEIVRMYVIRPRLIR